VPIFAIHDFVLSAFEIIKKGFSRNGFEIFGRFSLIAQVLTHLIFEAVSAFPFATDVLIWFSLGSFQDFLA
jgi:hypothetical protein